jgi:hypothetical protein
LTLPSGWEYIPAVVKGGDSSAGAGIRGVTEKANSYPLKVQGLLPLPSRFLPDAVVRSEPLVLAARIDVMGRLVDCKTGWVTSAWGKSREQGRSSSPMVGEMKSAVATGVDEFPHAPIAKRKWRQFWRYKPIESARSC